MLPVYWYLLNVTNKAIFLCRTFVVCRIFLLIKIHLFSVANVLHVATNTNNAYTYVEHVRQDVCLPHPSTLLDIVGYRW